MAVQTDTVKQPSKEQLRSYVEKYLIKQPAGEKSGYWHDPDGWYDLNYSALDELSLEERAEVCATMFGCDNGSITYSDEKTKTYIELLGGVYWANMSELVRYSSRNISDIALYMKAFAKYIICDQNYDIDYYLQMIADRYVNAIVYDSCEATGHSYYPNDFLLRDYNQVLDTFSLLDGKILSGSKRCVLLAERTHTIKVGKDYEKHTISVYLVTKPGRIKYSSLNSTTGKEETYKTTILKEEELDKDAIVMNPNTLEALLNGLTAKKFKETK